MSHTHLWLTGVDSNSDEDNNIRNKKEQIELTLDNKMDVNKKHKILHDPSGFHTPNQSHVAYIPEINQESRDKDENTIKLTLDNINTFDDYIQNNLFENSEEEIIFNYDKIEEDELDE